VPKLIHAMIRVADLERSKQFYCGALDMQVSHTMDFPSFTLVYLRDSESGFEIELTANKDQAQPYIHGTAYGHLAFCTDDLEELHLKFSDHGYAPGEIRQLRTADSAASFFFVTDPDGYKLEILHRSGHYV
jgi:lactoylglutathione lyase